MFLGGSMYLATITVERFRCFGEESNRFELPLRPGLTALVGENDVGKTAVIDALRFVLGTTDQEWYRLEDTDFYAGGTPREIRIVCKFEGLSARDKSAFVEYLTYAEKVPHFIREDRLVTDDRAEAAIGSGKDRGLVSRNELADGPARQGIDEEQQLPQWHILSEGDKVALVVAANQLSIWSNKENRVAGLPRLPIRGTDQQIRVSGAGHTFDSGSTGIFAEEERYRGLGPDDELRPLARRPQR
jgi:hypothetical protein